MKWKIQALSVIAFMLFVGCGNNSTDEKTTEDTIVATDNGPDRPAIGTVEVPMGIKTTFEERYPSATNVRWNRPDTNWVIDWEWSGWPVLDTAAYVASFNWDNADHWTWYDAMGNWVGTVSNVSDYTTLPAPVNFSLNKQYNGYTITSVKKENDKNRTVYEITIEKGNDKGKLLIDENGKILKKKINSGGTTTKEKTNPKDSGY